MRLARIRQLTTGHQERDVREALAAEWSEGLEPARIYIRRSFARLERPLTGPYGDRKLPPRELRPPSTRLIAPRGVALETFLTVLFVAQCHTGPGKTPRTVRRVFPHPKDATGLRPWSDLIAAPADHRPGTKTYYSSEDNRRRQIKSALNRLAGDDMRLIEFPNGRARSARVEGFRPLEESGRLRSASRVAYTVPQRGEDRFSIPREFFTSGWHLALTPSETALLLALWARSRTTPPSPDGILRLDGATRIQQYCLSPDAYASHKYLDAFGLLEVMPAEGRRPDGTIEAYTDGEAPIPHGLRILEDGFEKLAVATVMATLKGMP